MASNKFVGGNQREAGRYFVEAIVPGDLLAVRLERLALDVAQALAGFDEMHGHGVEKRWSDAGDDAQHV